VLPSGGPVYIPTSAFATYVLNNLTATNAPAVGIYTNAFQSVLHFLGRVPRHAGGRAALDPALGWRRLCGNIRLGRVQALRRELPEFGQ